MAPSVICCVQPTTRTLQVLIRSYYQLRRSSSCRRTSFIRSSAVRSSTARQKRYGPLRAQTMPVRTTGRSSLTLALLRLGNELCQVSRNKRKKSGERSILLPPRFLWTRSGGGNWTAATTIRETLGRQRWRCRRAERARVVVAPVRISLSASLSSSPRRAGTKAILCVLLPLLPRRSAPSSPEAFSFFVLFRRRPFEVAETRKMTPNRLPETYHWDGRAPRCMMGIIRRQRSGQPAAAHRTAAGNFWRNDGEV